MTPEQVYVELENIGGIRKLYTPTKELQKLYGGARKFSIIDTAIRYCGWPTMFKNCPRDFNPKEAGWKKWDIKEGLIELLAPDRYSKSHATFYAPPLVAAFPEIWEFLQSLDKAFGDYIGWSCWHDPNGKYWDYSNHDKLDEEDWYKKKEYVNTHILDILKKHNLVVETDY